MNLENSISVFSNEIYCQKIEKNCYQNKRKITTIDSYGRVNLTLQSTCYSQWQVVNSTLRREFYCHSIEKEPTMLNGYQSSLPVCIVACGGVSIVYLDTAFDFNLRLQFHLSKIIEQPNNSTVRAGLILSWILNYGGCTDKTAQIPVGLMLTWIAVVCRSWCL